MLTFLFLFFVASNALNKCPGLFDGSDPDYIIVGGGAGGSVALHRCVLAGHKCTLLERGTDYVDPFTQIPSQYIISYFGGSVRYANSAPLANMYNKTIGFMEPNIIGGSTSVNVMLSIFTDIRNLFREMNITGWSYEEMLPYYLSVTKSLNRPGWNGAVEVTNTPVTDPAYIAFKQAVTAVFPNIPERIPDMNTASITANFSGYGPPETTIKTSPSPVGNTATRSSGYTSYIAPIRAYPNVHILTGATVEKINFRSDNTRTKDVIVSLVNHLGVVQQCELSARKGVILSAGALRTPQILLRSGVGPAAELQALNISVARDNQYVGRNLDDHPSISDQFIGPSYEKLYSTNVNGHAYWNHQDNPALINDWTLQIVGILPTEYVPPGLKPALTQLMNQKSRGSVKIQANGEPIFDLGYFNNLEDLVPASIGYSKSKQIIDRLSYFSVTPVTCPPFLPDCQTNITSYYIASYLSYAAVGYHFAGTCALGTVVNPANGKVYGFEDLYVVDASILPKAPRGNTQISVYALAEKLSAVIF